MNDLPADTSQGGLGAVMAGVILRDLVVLPGQLTTLHAGSPTALAGLQAGADTGEPILCLPQRDGDIENPDVDHLYGHGCTAHVVKLLRFPDGAMRALVEGIERVSVERVLQLDPILLAEVRPHPEPRPGDAAEALLTPLLTEMRGLLAVDGTMPPDVDLAQARTRDPASLADYLGANLTLETEDRLTLLLPESTAERLERLLTLVTRQRKRAQIASEVMTRVQAAMDKQQRQYLLREQIRELRQELGEVDRLQEEVEKLQARIKESGMPEETRQEALREAQRLSRMHPDAAEWNVARTYLDWLLAMPWEVQTDDNVDLTEVEKILDEDHHGLARIKDRIAEYLSVRQLNPDHRGAILCFVGPPGVGKTSLGRSIARALGRRFERISLGGVRDESEIRGHRRTYVGALPGRIIQALRRAGSRNPVIILDELDKVGRDVRGDPASALLEALDPEQNSSFTDHYLHVPFDLSQVLFLCTANVSDTIPSALRDRLEVIQLPGYTEEEKHQIARTHLIPRALKSHGLESGQLPLGDDALTLLIRGYTMEAGVRGLERQVADVCRKVARRVVKKLELPEAIDPAVVEQMIGPRRHFPELAERIELPGIAVGLAWTEFGGEILFIEASRMRGSGRFRLTGQMGDVMKESAEAALSWIRYRGSELGLAHDYFQRHDLHLHIPQGAIPKDGPSAGVTMTIALMSLLTGRLVRGDLAMTGEITLRGRVMPVGGVKEKVLAARRAGIKQVVLPVRNRQDLRDIPEELQRDLEFTFVELIDEVVELAFRSDEGDG